MLRIDIHHHIVPPDYRKALEKAGIDAAGGRAMPEWTRETALQATDALGIAAGIASVSAPATTFMPTAADAAALARDVNDYNADLVATHPDRFGFFATVP